MNRNELDQMISTKQSINQSTDDQMSELLQLRAQLQEQIDQEQYEANRPFLDRLTERLSTNQFGLKILCFVLGLVSLAGSMELVRLSQTNKSAINEALVRYNQSTASLPRSDFTELQTIDQYLLHQSDNTSLTPEQREWILQLRQTLNQTIKQSSTDQYELSLKQRASEIKKELDLSRKQQ